MADRRCPVGRKEREGDLYPLRYSSLSPSTTGCLATQRALVGLLLDSILPRRALPSGRVRMRQEVGARSGMGETELLYLVCRVHLVYLVYFVQRTKERRRTRLQLSI